MDSKSTQINHRITPESRAILQEIEEETGIKAVDLVKAALTSIEKHWRKHRRISLPIRIVDETEGEITPPKKVKATG